MMPAGTDHWWEVDTATDVAHFAKGVATSVLRYGLPFFDAFRTKSEVLVRLRSGDGLPGLTDAQTPLVHAMLAVDDGSLAEAKTLLAEAHADARGSPFAETVVLIAERLAIALPTID